MAGRTLNPGESLKPGDILNPGGVHDRTIRAHISTCDAPNGVIKLDHYGFSALGREATIPWLWASFRSKTETAWGRYIPFDTDMVKVSFDYDDKPHIVGYDVIAGDPKKSGPDVGWAGLREAYENDEIPDFFTLNPGEFDFKSVGGAYIFGSDGGELLLQGGLATIDLDKGTNEILSTARLHVDVATSSEIRFGEVRRPVPVVLTESSVGPWNPTSLGQEFDVNLKYNDGATDHNIARLGIGNLATDTSVEMAGSGMPKLLAVELYDTAGIMKVFNLEVDSIGSTSISAQTAPNFNIDYPLATVNINGREIVLSAIGVKVGGSGSSEPLVLGFVLVQALLELVAGAIQSPVGPCYINPAWASRYLVSPLNNILSLRHTTER